MAYFCEGLATRWSVALTSADVEISKPRLLIVGAGGHGRSVAEAVLMSGDYDLIGFLGDGMFANVAEMWGFPVLGEAKNFADYSEVATHAVVAMGNNALRQNLCRQLLSAGFALASVIHPRAIVSPRASIGDGVVVMAGAVVGTEAVLGQGAVINCGAVVDHHAQVHDFGHLGVNTCMAGGSVVGALAWMQAGSAIGYGVQLPAGEVLKPGAAI